MPAGKGLSMRSPSALNRVLALSFCAMLGMTALILERVLNSRALDEVREAALRQMQTGEAIRRYTVEHLQGVVLAEGQQGFNPSAVPSFAANTAMRYLSTAYPGYSYREIALNPTNPANRAMGWEVQTLQGLRKSGATSVSEVVDGKWLRYAKPIVVRSGACLNCHGDAAVAPASLLSRYGSVNGFGWQLGEVVGAQLVSVSLEKAFENKSRLLIYYLAGCGFIFAALFVALNWSLRRMVMQPIQAAGEGWRKLASEDALTGAAARRSIVDSLGHEVARLRPGDVLSVVMFDADHFKGVNDAYGHAAGDEVLKAIVERASHCLHRPRDAVGRLGGEEFCMLLPGTNLAGALAVAEQVRLAIATQAVRAAGDLEISVTVSLGVAQWQPGESAEALLARADASLYNAKRQGRNRVDAGPPTDGPAGSR